MPVGRSISNSWLHCGLIILILFILIFLSIPLLLINISNSRFERLQSEKELNCTQYANRTSNDGHPVQCPSGYFPCILCPDICVEQWKMCDGNTDCPDRSDESSCHDSNGAMNHMFKRIVESSSLWNKNKSSLVSKQVAETNTGSSSSSSSSGGGGGGGSRETTTATSASQWHLAKPESCPMDEFINEQCPCNLTETNVVICDGQNLRKIPRGLRASVFKIRMSDNQLTSLESAEWPAALTSLVLVNNQLTHLGRGAFRSAPSLAKIYLSHNNISYIDPEAFVNLSQLTTLLLESNLLSNFETRALAQMPKIYKIHLSDNLIELDEDTRFSEGREIKELLLDHNRITFIRAHYFSNMTRLIWLSLTHNQISAIEDKAFDWNYDLQELNLSFNKIKSINRLLFHRRLNLQRLYLSGNPLETLPQDAFDEIVELKSLNLSLIEFANLNKTTFQNLKHLEFIYFAKFRFCHFANHVRVCRPSTDGLSSLDELLLFPILKYAVWIVALVCVLGNVFVFIWRSISPYEDRTLSFYVKNLSIADLLMGIYLSVIGYYDMEWRHDFGKHAIDWMSSPNCTTLGFLAILSSELSVFILTIITIERYRSITSIKQHGDETQKRRARLSVGLAWIMAILVASYLPIEWLRRQPDYYATNGLCLPLNINQPYSRGWQYSAFIYLGINLSAVLIMMILYAHMYTMIMSSHKRARPFLFKTDKREDAILAFRFFFIVVTNCLCWIPIGVIKVYALFKPELRIPSTIYSWLVIFIIPINSALNPLVYTLAAPTSLRAAVCRAFQRLYYRLDLLIWPLSSENHHHHRHRHHHHHHHNHHHGSGSEASALNCSGYSSTTNNSTDTQSTASTSGRRRRKTGSNSTTTCDTFDTSIISHSKASVESSQQIHEDAAAALRAVPTLNGADLLVNSKDSFQVKFERASSVSLGTEQRVIQQQSSTILLVSLGNEKKSLSSEPEEHEQQQQPRQQSSRRNSSLLNSELNNNSRLQSKPFLHHHHHHKHHVMDNNKDLTSSSGNYNNHSETSGVLSLGQSAKKLHEKDGAVQHRIIHDTDERAKFTDLLQSVLNDRSRSSTSTSSSTSSAVASAGLAVERNTRQRQLVGSANAARTHHYRPPNLALRCSDSNDATSPLLDHDTTMAPSAPPKNDDTGGGTGYSCDRTVSAPGSRESLNGLADGALNCRSADVDDDHDHGADDNYDCGFNYFRANIPAHCKGRQQGSRVAALVRSDGAQGNNFYPSLSASSTPLEQDSDETRDGDIITANINGLVKHASSLRNSSGHHSSRRNHSSSSSSSTPLLGQQSQLQQVSLEGTPSSGSTRSRQTRVSFSSSNSRS